MYLEPEPGDAGTSNILNMARQGLAQDLKIALHDAVQHQRIVRRGGLRVRTNGAFTSVNLTVSPLLPEADDLSPPMRCLVVLEQAPAVDADTVPASAPALKPGPEVDARIAELEHELHATERLLRTARANTGTSNEELSSALEEMQSVNEELQSSNEELATSQEELQSVNEELSTVNVEQQSRVLELARALNDNRNLLAGTGIATVFVDLRQRVMSFTPTVTRIIDLVPSDVGRPLANFVANLRGYDRLSEDIASVLDTLVPKEVKVQAKAGHWYMLRILPYRTLENIIEGAAVTFVDISEIVKAQVDIAQLHQAHVALRESEQRYRCVVTALDEGLVLLGSDDKIKAWNPATERILGLSAAQLQGMQDFDPAWRSIHEDGSPFPLETWPGWEVLRTGVPRTGAVMAIQRPGSALLWVSINAVPIRDPDDPSKPAVVVTFIDITERKRVEALSQEASEARRLGVVVRDSHDAITLHALDGRTLAWNPAAQRLYGWTEAEALQMNLLDRVPLDQRELALDRLLRLGQAQTLEPYRAQRLTKDGSVLDVSITASAVRDAAGQVYAVATTERAGAAGGPA
jgi:two-component system, chemotaxis family, CheB/CheR fusion protein